MKEDKDRQIDGIGPDARIIENKKGGKQSDTPYRFDLVDPKAMFELARILGRGAEKYDTNNWRLISRRNHLNHCIVHIMGYMAGDIQESDHLSHALCRLMMAIGVEEGELYPYDKIPEKNLSRDRTKS